MLIGSFVLRSSSLLLSLVDLVLMEPLVDVDRFIRSSLFFAPLVACRSRPHGTYSSSFLLPGWSHSRPSLMPPLGLFFSFEVQKKKIPDFHGPFLFSESRFLPVRVVVRMTGVVLRCLVLSCVVFCRCLT